MKRIVEIVVLGLAVLAGVRAFAEYGMKAEVPLSAVIYCERSGEFVVLEGTVSSQWDWSSEAATLWRVSFAGVKGIGMVSGKRYEIVGDLVERIEPALGPATDTVRLSPTVQMCCSGSSGPGTCLQWDVTVTFKNPGTPAQLVSISGRLHRL